MFTSSDGGDGTLGNAALPDTSFTPSAAGTVVLTLTVTDSSTPPATGTALHTLTVSEVVPTTIGPAAALAGAVTEAGATDTTGLPTASGALMLLDADSTEVPGGSYAFASGASGTGLYGDLTLNANGTWSYMLDNGAPATEALAGGAEKRDTFDIEGSLGATTLAGIITLAVTGANDAPSAAITAPATAEVGTSVNLVGSASADPDSGDSIASHAWTFTGSDGGDGTLGNAALADTSFTPSAAGTVVLTLTVTDSATPPATGTALHTLTVSEVVPTTIGPAAALAGAVTEAGATDTTGLPTASGALMLLDADSTEVPGGSYAFASGASGTGLYGDLTLNANGTWSYMLDNGAPATEALAGGAEERDTFDIEGSLGATTLAGIITLAVTGANDAPSAAITAPATAEVGTSVNLVGSASADPDSGDSIASHAWMFTSSDGGDGTLGNAALPDTSFTPSAAGTVVLTLTVTDSSTPPATGTALHTLTVSEVVPTTIGPAAALAGAVTEAGATDTTGLPTASGALMLLDADSTEVPGGSYAFASGASGTGLYGDLTLNANGTWSYMLDNGAPATEALAGGAEERDTFDIEGSLGVTTLSGTITLTVTGANDAPSAAITAPATAEVGTSVNLVGSASADPDSGDSIASHAWMFTSSDGGAGTLGNAALADTSFTPSAAGTVVLTLTVTDSATPPATGTALHTLTVAAAPDTAPTSLTGNLTASVTVGGANPAGTVSVLPADATNTSITPLNEAGTHGTFDIAANGAWTYTLGATATQRDNLQTLSQGRTIDDPFTITAAGDNSVTANVVITLTGVNDNPTATIAVPAGNMTVNFGAVVDLEGSARDADEVDASGTPEAVTLQWSANPDRGTFGDANAATTTWTAPNEAGAVVLTLTATDTNSATGTATVTITVQASTDTVPAFAAGTTLANQTYTVNMSISTLTLPTATGGNSPLTYRLADASGNLPDGLSFDSSTRVLSGMPTMVQDATDYTYTVADGDANTAPSDEDTLTFTITVRASTQEGERERAQREQATEDTIAAFGRTVAVDLVRMMDARARAAKSPSGGSSQATIAGRTLSLDQRNASAGDKPATHSPSPALPAAGGLSGRSGETGQPVGDGAGFHAVDLRRLLTGSSFQMALDGAGWASSSPTLWGRGSVSNFNGKRQNNFSTDGDVYSGQIGVDFQVIPNMLAGLAVNYSESDSDYAFSGGTTGEIDTDLTSIHPYVHWSGERGLGLWLMLGYGEGEATLEDDDGKVDTDLDMEMVAVGLHRDMYSGWALKADAFFMQVDAEEETGLLNEVETDVWQLRLGLEKNRNLLLSDGATMQASGELAARLDGGDAETGLGVDVNGDLVYTHPRLGLSLAAQGHYLLVHAGSNFDEWGVSLSAMFDPGAPDRGLRLSLTPSLGTVSEGGQLWEDGRFIASAVEGETDPSMPVNMSAEAAYGLSMMDERGLLTPFSAFSWSGQERYAHLGTRMKMAGAQHLEMEFALYGEQKYETDAVGGLSGVLDSRVRRVLVRDLAVIEWFGTLRAGGTDDYQFGVEATLGF